MTLYELRQKAKKSPAEAAVAAECSTATIHNWEKGMTKGMSFYAAIRLSKLYGVSMDALAKTVFPENDE